LDANKTDIARPLCQGSCREIRELAPVTGWLSGQDAALAFMKKAALMKIGKGLWVAD